MLSKRSFGDSGARFSFLCRNFALRKKQLHFLSMRKTLLLLLLIFLGVNAFSQHSVQGKVYGKLDKLPVPYATVVLQQGSKILKRAVTDTEGFFSFAGLASGNYNLKVSVVGYETAERDISFPTSRRNLRIDSLFISETRLGEALVVGQRSSMRLEVDRKSYDVDQQISNAGGSASEALENIPSVEVDQDGNVSLRGNSSVEVWINGKASGLTSDNRAEILQQLPAESIERIEVIDNPSAKFSAEGSAGIINIILKKDRKAGYYGSLQVGGNTNGGANTSGNINYSSSLVDAYLNVGYRHRQNSRGGSWSRQTFLQSGEYQNYDSKNYSQGNNLFSRAGLTLHATSKDDISLGGMMMIGGFNNNNTMLYHYGTQGAAADARQMTRRSRSDGDMRMLHGELGYRHEFSTTHFLEANLEYNRWSMDDESTYRDSTLYLDGSLPTAYDYQRRPNEIRNRSWEFKLDYENQISESFKVQAGYSARLSHENTPQHAYIDDAHWDGVNVVEDENFFNRFIYDQDVHAAYATVSTKVGPVGVMAGLRGEYWKVNTESYNFEQEHNPSLRPEPFKKDYFQLFPSVFLSYQLSDSQQLQLNYTRRLRRPWGGQLNSFKNTRDASIIEYGNPELTPEFSNSFSLNYIKTWEDHTLSLSAYYRPTTDVIQRLQYRSQTDGMMYSTHENLTKSVSTGLEIVSKNKLFTRLDLTTTANFYYYHLDGFSYVIDNQTITGASDHNFSWNVRMQGSLMLPHEFTVQLTGNYRSKQVVTQGYRKANYSMDLGIRKTFFNKMFALSLNCRDLLDSRKWETVTESDQFTRHQRNWRGGRNVNLTLTWNFGNMKQKPSKRRNDNAQMGEEMQNSYTGETEE